MTIVHTNPLITVATLNPNCCSPFFPYKIILEVPSLYTNGLERIKVEREKDKNIPQTEKCTIDNLY